MPILAKIATVRRLGRISRNISMRLPAKSGVCIDRPVTLPPGRASEATRPVPTRSPAPAITIGMTFVAFFAAMDDGVPLVTMTSTLSRMNSSRDLGEALLASLRPAILDGDGSILDPAEFAQPLHKSSGPLALG